MDEYIERDEAIKAVISAKWEHGSDGAMAMEIVAGAPVVDVRPERHGRWILDDSDEYANHFHCSRCGFEKDTCNEIYVESPPLYCEHCGAKMDGSSKSDGWIATSEQLPVENQIVDTKIDDEKGVRNERELVYSHNLWFFPDFSMYVYYTPTHWRRKERAGGKGGESDENR